MLAVNINTKKATKTSEKTRIKLRHEKGGYGHMRTASA